MPKNASRYKKSVGAIYRIGYYSRADGLDCIWLVNEAGKYQETVDHDYLYNHFDVIQFSDEKSLYGAKRPKICPVKIAVRRPRRR